MFDIEKQHCSFAHSERDAIMLNQRFIRMQISVVGSSEATPETMQLAEAVGRELGLRGATVVTGGLGGVMEAASMGAKNVGGVTIGIIPGVDPSEANDYVDIPICTGIGYARNLIVVRSGRAVIAVSGAFGTLSEIAYALGDSIPVIGLKTWSFSRNGQDDISIILAKNPVDAVEKALAAAQLRNATCEVKSTHA